MEIKITIINYPDEVFKGFFTKVLNKHEGEGKTTVPAKEFVLDFDAMMWLNYKECEFACSAFMAMFATLQQFEDVIPSKS